MRFVSLKDAHIYEYIGGVLRGAFGNALYSISKCPFNKPQCNKCELATECPYGVLFESPSWLAPVKPEWKAGISKAPHPFAIFPKTLQKKFEAQAPLEFEFVLIGNGYKWHKVVIDAIYKMSEIGIGRKRNKFAVDSIVDLASNVDLSKSNNPPQMITVVPHTNSQHKLDLLIKFLTPVRILKNKTLTKPVEFSTIFYAALRRLALLTAYWGQNPLEVQIDDNLRKNINSVESTNWGIEKVEVAWGSTRQHRKIKLRGYVGEVRFKSVPQQLASVIGWAELVGIGKGTSMGLGKIQTIWE